MDQKPFSPYEYQQRVYSQFLSGQNLILQAPTGAGKTEAALLPGIACLDLGSMDRQQMAEYPQRIIYNVPMRVLARGFVEKYTERAKHRHWESSWYPTIQTGESPEDPLFEGRVIFATVDQMLASFLNIPYGLPSKLDNINAGAMIGSYLIFDEFHLYPRDQMMLTVLAMLKMLEGVSRFVLMSATFSPVFLKEIACVLNVEVIADEPGTPLDKGLFSDVRSVQTQRRTFIAEEGSLSAETVLERRGTRTLCICNTVDRAQALYKALRKVSDIECRLLHSRFYREDRQQIETFVRERFEHSDKPTILIATQVVEVGLDISSDVLLTECAPAASLIQRAGRCARRDGESGEVYVFQPFDDEDRVNYAPYLDDDQESICHKTWTALCSDEFNGKVMRFPQEQRLIEFAHGESDQQLVDGLDAKIDARIEQITDCMASRHPGYAAQLIRSQDTVPLYIHSAPNKDTALTRHPWRREAFSLSKGLISRTFKTLQDWTDGEADFLFCAGVEAASDDDSDNFKWEPLREASEVFSPQLWRFVAHPHVVSYSSDTGLELRPGTEPARESPVTLPKVWERPVYEAERYHEHILGLKFAYEKPRTGSERLYDGRHVDRSHSALRDEILYSLRRLCEYMSLDFVQAERLLRLVLALHDVGKLNKPWQAWSRAWQKFRLANGYQVTISLDDPDPLAHTDYDRDSEEERELQQQLKHPPRGNHAGESAEACLPILWEATGGNHFWMAVTVGAIMHHHTPNVKEAGAFRLISDAEPSFVKVLSSLGFDNEGKEWFGKLSKSFGHSGKALEQYAKAVTPNRSDYHTALMYYLFVRTLRLADQRSGKYWQRYRTSNLNPDYESETDR